MGLNGKSATITGAPVNVWAELDTIKHNRGRYMLKRAKDVNNAYKMACDETDIHYRSDLKPAGAIADKDGGLSLMYEFSTIE